MVWRSVACWLGVALSLGCDGKSPATVASGGEASGSAGVAGGGPTSQGGSASGGVPTAGGAGEPSSSGSGGSATAGGGVGGTAAQPWTPKLETRALSTEFMAEGAAIGDIDGDGAVDVWAGPRWYAGPDFALGGNVFADAVFPLTEYSTHFLAFLDDLDGDQDLDGVMYGFPGEDVRWYENPGPAELDSSWPVHPMVATGVGNESPAYVDLVGDERRELVFMTGGRLGYATPGATPTSAWSFIPIGPDLGMDRYTHGLGVGDLNGDDLPDVVERTGVWLQQPGQMWQRHQVDFAQGARGGAQMLIDDVDGDGDADVVTSLDAHGYGLSWFEQTTSGAELTFSAHEILPAGASVDNFSQLHALVQVDLNGDGLLDFVTGKRFYAHAPPTDPGGTDPAVLVWFELSRAGGVKFTPHPIHADSGVGTSFEAGDLNADGKPDLAITNKKGTFLHVQE